MERALWNRSTDSAAFVPYYPPFRWLHRSRIELAGLLALWIALWTAYTVLFKYWVTVPWTNAVLLTIGLHTVAVACDGVRLARWRRTGQ